MATHTAPILDRILESRRASIARLKASGTFSGLPQSASATPPARDFRGALSRPGVALIAECKQRSPSGGVLQRDYDPVGLARRYAANGASAISVLTEPEFFGGGLHQLPTGDTAGGVPGPSKGLLLHPVQVNGVRSVGD